MAERQSHPDGDTRPPAPEPLPVGVVDNHTHLELCVSAVPAQESAFMTRGTGSSPQESGLLGSGTPSTSQESGFLPAEIGRLLDLATEAGVPRSVQIGCDLEAARWTVEAVERYPQLLGGVAIHPNEAPALAASGRLDDALEEIERLAQHDRVRVVGETGLDYFRTDPRNSRAIAAQQLSFRAHIDMAKRLGLALQIHDRDAHADVLRVLEEEGAPERTVFHCFSGDAAMARYCVDRGYYLSFAGTLTFKNAADLREALLVAPPELTLVETDAPYLTPVPYRGRPNAGYLVPLTVRAMAQLRGADLDGVCAALASSSEAVYGTW